MLIYEHILRDFFTYEKRDTKKGRCNIPRPILVKCILFNTIGSEVEQYGGIKIQKRRRGTACNYAAAAAGYLSHVHAIG